MDFRQLEYILTIAEENNITRAAEKLYISQSALNQQLLKLEKELGCQLFVRSRTDWHATEAGEIYLEGARQAMMIRRDTYARINDLIHSEKATLRIGLPPSRGFKMFLEIYPQLRERFPNLMVTPEELGAHAQQRAVSEGKIDIGFLLLSEEDKSADHYIDIGREEMVVIVPKGCASAPAQEEPRIGDLPVIDLAKLKDEPFAVMYENSTSRSVQNRIFASSGVVPHIVMESSSTQSLLYLTETGMCCAIVPSHYLMKADFEKISAFALKSHPTWKLCVIYKRGSYLSDAAHAFIGLAVDYWEKRLIPIQTN